MQTKLSPAEKNAIEQRPTSDVAAFELYSRAKDLILNTGFSAIRAQNLRQGIELLNAALARDPSFFAAQYQLVLAQDNLYTLAIDRTPQRLALAEKALEALRARFRSLSPREREILIQVAHGRLSKQIAGDMGITETTVKVHRSRAMRKMNARSLPELGRMVDKLKLAPEKPQRS